jgi:hypothetical protein
MHHLPDDRPGPDQRDFDDEVVDFSGRNQAASPFARDSTWKTPMVSAARNMA